MNPALYICMFICFVCVFSARWRVVMELRNGRLCAAPLTMPSASVWTTNLRTSKPVCWPHVQVSYLIAIYTVNIEVMCVIHYYKKMPEICVTKRCICNKKWPLHTSALGLQFIFLFPNHWFYWNISTVFLSTFRWPRELPHPVALQSRPWVPRTQDLLK